MSDFEDYESGPFCQHWSHPSDCDEMCRCGHLCSQHLGADECLADDCDCESFEDEDE